MNIDEAITLLEEKAKDYAGQVPGTAISRILLDKVFCAEWGVPCPPDRECARAWCLSLGGMSAPRVLIYGATIEQAVQKALKSFDAVKEKTEATWAEIGNLLSKQE